ncbi:MAG: methionine--tRNA ligase [Candidatus Gracilibacteria bacterium]|jgi:methionyl-tRNA synthetase
MDSFYLTNAIAYTNAGPHMGHALEAVQGDALTRYHRLQGEEVFFLVGTDEHGSKNEQVAREKGVTPQELADTNSALFLDFHKKVNAANDDFIRTTSERHKEGARKLWTELEAAGVFYEKEYEGKYCMGCEAFILDKDLVDGKCAVHLKEPQILKEKNIFFKLSQYSEAIKQKVESGELLIRPASRRNEFLSLLEEGLRDVSFSRPKKSLNWGIEVPGHEDQVMYVWCDALSNYISALGYAERSEAFKKWWPAAVHLIGKDIIRFHCGIWIGMLMAAGLPLPKAIFVHGFVTSEGQKMSKSLGNVVDPIALIEEWGSDPVRYYLLREIPSDEDGDFSRDRFAAVYKDELQNTIGNLVRRVATLCIKNFDGKVEKRKDEMEEVWTKTWERYHKGFLNFDMRSSIEAMLELARFGNLYTDENKPWELAKTDPKRLAVVLGNLIQLCSGLGEMLQPIIPEAAQKILDQVSGETIVLGEPLFPHHGLSQLGGTDSAGA